jgi:cell wall assembly regulator SMI1
LRDVIDRYLEIRQTPAGTRDGLFPFHPPAPPATHRDIAALENALGRPLPSELRSLLEFHNGWPQFFHTIDLLSVDQMISGPHARKARMLLDMAVEVYGPVWEDVAFTEALPIGLSVKEGDMILLNPLRVNNRGDWEAIWFRNEIIERRPTLRELINMFGYLIRR